VSHFGAHAMAGFGVGTRITQALCMPAMAIAFAIPAIIAQNIGAGKVARVREIIIRSLQIVTAMMILALLLCKLIPETLVNGFVQETDAKFIAVEYIRLISWNFIASGLVFATSGIFQAFGNTWPSLLSTSLRLFTFAVPALYLSRTTDFAITDIWMLSVVTVGLQALVSLLLLRRECRLPQKCMLLVAA
jgi:Na+-driven multidrug efflux pump